MSSTTIDKRVVEMEFNNSNFEKNAKTSINTLKNLKNSLNLDSAVDGLKNFSNTAKSINLDSVGKSIDTIASRFSAFGIVSTQLLRNLTNEAEMAAKKLLDAFMFRGARDGFAEYELQMNSVQTIMASTGESVATVNKYLDELNLYADKTIYSFSDMTQNIGKFTNAGVKLEDAVAAIKGISNEAAVSGANANEASRAMYNFAQALSAGYVKLIDWKSIENANMATVEFKNELLETAVAQGVLTKQGNMYVTQQGHTMNATKEFNEYLKDEWMTTNVLVSTLKKYTDVTTDIGKKATEAATKVKTFTQLVDTLKEAIGSGWLKTWQLIIGDFEEAKELFTMLSDRFGKLIDVTSNARNNLLEGALGVSSSLVDKGFRKAYDDLLNARDGLISVNEWKSVQAASKNTAELRKNLIDAAVAAGELTKKEHLYVTETGKAYSANELFSTGLKDGWLTSTNALDGLTKAEQKHAKTADSAKKTLESFKDQILETAEAKGLLDASMSKDQQWSDLLQNGKLTSSLLDEVIGKLKNGMKEATGSAITDVNDLSKATTEYGMTLQEIEALAWTVIRGDYGNGQDRVNAMAAAGLDYDTIQSYVNYIYWGGEMSDYFFYSQLKLTDAMGNNVAMTDEQIKALEELSKAAQAAGMSIDEYIEAMNRPTGRELLVRSLVNVMNAVSKVVHAVKDAFTDVFPPLTSETLYKLIEGFERFTSKLVMTDETAENLRRTFRGFFSVVNILLAPVRIIGSLLAGIGSHAGNVASGFLQITGSIGDFFYNIKKTLDSVGALNIVIEGLKVVLEPLGRVFDFVTEKIGAAVSWVLEWLNLNKVVGDVLEGNVDKTNMYNKALVGFDKVRNVFAKMADGINLAIDKVKSAFEWFKNLPLVQKGIDAFKSAASISFATLRSSLSVMGQRFKIFLNTIKNLDGFSFENLKKGVRSFYDNVIKSGFTYISNSANPFISVFQKVFGKISDFVGSFVTEIKEFIKQFAEEHPVIKPLVDFIDKVHDTFADAFGENGTISKAKENATNMFDSIINVFKGFVENSKSLPKSIGSVFKSILDTIQQYLGGIILLVSGFMFLKGAKAIKDIFSPIKDLVAGIKGVLDSTAKLNKAEAFKKRAEGILIIAVSLGILVLAIRELVKIDNWKAVGIATGILAGFMVALAGMIIAIDKFTGNSLRSTAKMVSIAGLLIGLAATMASIAFAFKTLDGLENTSRDIDTFCKIIISMMAFMALVGVAKPNIAGGALVLIGMAGAIFTIAKSLQKLDELNPDTIKRNLGILTYILGLLEVLLLTTKIPGNGGGFGTLGILEITLALTVMINAIKMIGRIDQAVLAKGVGVITFLLLELSGIIATIGLFMKNDRAGNAEKAGALILAMAGSLILMSMAMKIMAGIDKGDIIKGTLTIGALMLFMGLFVSLTKVGEKGNYKDVGKMFLPMAISLLLIAGAVAVLGVIPTENLVKGVAAIAVIMGMFALITRAAKDVQKGVGLIVTITVAVAVLTASILSLSMLKEDQLKNASLALGGVMLCFAGIIEASKYGDKIKWTTFLQSLLFMVSAVEIIRLIAAIVNDDNADAVLKGVLALIGVVAALSGLMLAMAGVSKIQGQGTFKPSTLLSSIAMLASAIAAIWAISAITDKYGTENLMTGIEALGAVLGEMVVVTGAIALLSKYVGTGEGMIALGTKMAIIFDIISVIVGGLAGLIGFLDEQFLDGKATEFITRGMDSLKAITDGIAEILGGFISSFAEGLTSSLPDIGLDLMTFASYLNSAFALLTSVDTENISKVKDIATALLEITGANILERISELIGGDSIADFGPKMEEFAGALKTFSDALNPSDGSIDLDKVVAGAEAVKNISLAMALIPRDNKLFDWILGEKLDGEELKSQFEGLGGAISAFATYAEMLPEGASDSIQRACDAAALLVDLSKTIPREGGWIDAIFGSNDMDTFGRQAVSFVMSLYSFSTMAKFLGDEEIKAIEKSTEAAGHLTDLAKELDPTGGIMQVFMGETDLGTFGNTLLGFANGLVSFSSMIGLIKDDAWGKFELAADSAKHLTTLAQNIEPIGGLISNFIGKDDLGTFGDTIKVFGDGLKNFVGSIDGMTDEDFGKFQTVSEAASHLVDLSNSIVSVGGIFTSSNGLDKLGYSLTQFGDWIVQYADRLSELDATDIVNMNTVNRAIEAISQASSYITVISLMNTDNFATNLGNLGTGLGLFSLRTSGISDFSNLSDAILSISDLATSLNGVNFDGISEISKSLADMLSSLTEMSGSDASFSGFSTAMYDAAVDGVKSFSDGFTDSKEGLTNCADSLYSALETAITDIAAKFKTFGTSVAGYIASGITTGTASVRIACTNMLNNAVSALTNGYNRFYQAGRYEAEGFANGISSNQALITQVSKNMVDVSQKAITDQAVIKSPSRMTMKDGLYMVLGFANGILKNTKYAADAAGQMTGITLSAIDDSIAAINYALEDMDTISPVITPVLDMSNVESGLTSLNGMFSSNRTMSIAADVKADSLRADSLGDDIKELTSIGRKLLSAVSEGSDIYLNENLIIGRINRRLGMI